MLIIPKILAENSGHDVQESLISVQEQQEAGLMVGFDVFSGEPIDPMVSCDEQPGVQVKMVVRAAHSSHPVHHSPHSPHSRPSFGSPRLVAPAPHPVPAPPRSSSPREIWRAHDWCTEYSKKKKKPRERSGALMS